MMHTRWQGASTLTTVGEAGTAIDWAAYSACRKTNPQSLKFPTFAPGFKRYIAYEVIDGVARPIEGQETAKDTHSVAVPPCGLKKADKLKLPVVVSPCRLRSVARKPVSKLSVADERRK
jgi:hypothetical protein